MKTIFTRTPATVGRHITDDEALKEEAAELADIATAPWAGGMAFILLAVITWNHHDSLTLPQIGTRILGGLILLALSLWLGGNRAGLTASVLLTGCIVVLALLGEKTGTAALLGVTFGLCILGAVALRAARYRVAWIAVAIGHDLRLWLKDARPLPRAVRLPFWPSFLGRSTPLEWRPPAGVKNSPELTQGVKSAATAFLAQPVTTQWKKDGRCTIVPDLSDDAPDEESSADKSRLDAVLARLIGRGAQVESIEYDDEKISEIVFIWEPELGVKIASRAYQSRVVSALSSVLGFSVTVDWQTTQDRAILTRLETLPDEVAHPGRDPHTKDAEVTLGVKRGGRTVTWSFDDVNPHMLIVGTTGGGKSVLLRTIIGGLAHNVEVEACDPKYIGLAGMEKMPAVTRISRETDDMVEMVQNFHAEVLDRYAMLQKNPRAMATLHRKILVIDEARSFRERVKAHWGQNKKQIAEDLGVSATGSEHPVMQTLFDILRLGREGKMHVILVSQQADASWLTTEARGNMGYVVGLGNLSREASIMAFGSTVATAGLEPKAGRAWVQMGTGQPLEQGQIFWTPKIEPGLSEDDRAILRRLSIDTDDLDDDHSVSAVVSDRDVPTDENVEHKASPAGFEVNGERPASTPKESPPSVDSEGHDGDNVESDPSNSTVEEAPPAGTPVSVLDLVDGDRIILDDEAEDARPVTVEALEADPGDDGLTALTYRDDTGNTGIVSLDESLTILRLNDDEGDEES